MAALVRCWPTPAHLSHHHRHRHCHRRCCHPHGRCHHCRHCLHFRHCRHRHHLRTIYLNIGAKTVNAFLIFSSFDKVVNFQDQLQIISILLASQSLSLTDISNK